MNFSNTILTFSLIFAGKAFATESSSRSALRGGNNDRQLKGGAMCKDMPRGESWHRMGSGGYKVDGAYIHQDCSGDNYPVYYTETDDNPLTFGTGWYCNDGKDVQDLMCDNAYIREDCTGEGQLVEYNGNYWQCKNNNNRRLGGGTLCKDMPRDVHCNHPGSGCTMMDGAYIHQGCSDGNYPEYFTATDDHPLTFGSGWYCNDGKDVQDLTCDEAYIWTDCTGTGQLVEYTGDYWQCNHN